MSDISVRPMIVIIDDEEAVLRVMCFFLERYGYSVATYEDARIALDQYDFAHCDLIITDLGMPMPGEEVVAELQRRQIEVPVLIMSGDIGSKKEALQAVGIDRFLRKPFTPEELFEAIRGP